MSTQNHALYWVGLSLLEAHDLLGKLHVDPTTAKTLILELEDGYISKNSYHTSLHAADVTQAVGFFLLQVTPVSSTR